MQKPYHRALYPPGFLIAVALVLEKKEGGDGGGV